MLDKSDGGKAEREIGTINALWKPPLLEGSAAWLASRIPVVKEIPGGAIAPHSELVRLEFKLTFGSRAVRLTSRNFTKTGNDVSATGVVAGRQVSIQVPQDSLPTPEEVRRA